MTFRRSLSSFALGILLSLSSITGSSAQLAGSFAMPPVTPQIDLHAVDTILFSVTYGPRAGYVLFGPDDHWEDFYGTVCVPIDRAFRSLFSSQPAIHIYDEYDNCAPPSPEFSLFDKSTVRAEAPNVVDVDFFISAREEIVNGKHVKTATLSVQLIHSMPSGDYVNLSDTPITYPFAVPDTREELKQELADGVRYLTRSFPSLFCDDHAQGKPCPKHAPENSR